MRYNNCYDNYKKNYAWNWWDTLGTALTGGLYAAGKGISEGLNSGLNGAIEKSKENLRTGAGSIQPERVQQYNDLVQKYEELYGKYNTEMRTQNPDWVDLDKFSYDTINASDSLENYAREYGEGGSKYNALKEAYDALNTSYTGATDKRKAEEDAQSTAMGSAQSTAEAKSQAASTLGMTKARAGSLSGENVVNDYTGTYNSTAEGYRNLQAQTQADWLEKQGYTNALNMQASNLANSATLATLASIFQGAGSGMATGASIGSSFSRS